MEFLGSKGLGDITILEDSKRVAADQDSVSSILPRLIVIDNFSIVKILIKKCLLQC